jgi:hypothetical protein
MLRVNEDQTDRIELIDLPSRRSGRPAARGSEGDLKFDVDRYRKLLAEAGRRD